MSVNDYDIDLYEAVEDTKDAGELEPDTPAYGIAQKIIHEGEGDLSERQLAVYRKYVLPALSKRQAEIDVLHRDLRS